MAQRSTSPDQPAGQPYREPYERPSARRRDEAPTAADLVATGRVSAQQAYAATLVLARLHDRGTALHMTIEEMCEVLGYLGDGRRPKAVPKDRPAPTHLRGQGTHSEAS